MKKDNLLFVLAIIVIVAGLGVCALAIAFTGRADGAMVTPACPAIIRVNFGAGVNVRPKAGGPGEPGNAVIKTLHFEDGEFVVLEGPVTKNGDEWLRIEGGWIWNSSLNVVCAPTATPSATRTATPRATPTSGPTNTARPVVTPTRLAVQLLYCAGTPTVVQVETGLWRVTCDYR